MADYSADILHEIQVSRNLATGMLEDAQALADEIREAIAGQAPAPILGVTLPSLEGITFNRPDAPVTSNALDAVTFPEAPAEPVLGAAPSFSLPPVPDMEIAFPAVDFTAGQPTPFAADPPSEPGDLSPINMPSVPTLVFPDAPSVGNILIPDVPTLALPTFDATLGNAPAAPSTAFAWSETGYSSPLLTAMTALYLSWIEGTSTGLDPAVEEAIWNRARDRDAAMYASALTQIAGDFAARGHPLPPGAAAQMAEQAIQKARESAGTVNREVMVKQAEMEQQNRQFALTQAWQVESGLLTYWNQQMQRAYDAARYVVEAAIAIFQAQISQYNADVQAFGVRAQVYKTQIEAELAKLEIFKAQIEAQRLNVALTEQTVNVYRARLDALKNLVELYNAQVNAQKTIAETNRTVIEGFKARVDAYGERVKAKALEYDAYETSIKAEVAKLEVPKVQADVLKSRSLAYEATVDGLTKAAALQIKVSSEMPLEAYKAKTAAFAAVVDGIAEQVKAMSSVYEVNAKIYDSKVKAEASAVDAQVKIGTANLDASAKAAELNIEATKANVVAYVETARLKVEAARAAATILAQLAAGATAGVSVAAHLSQSGSSSVSLSNSNSRSSIASASTSASASASVSASASAVNSNSLSNSTNHNYNHTDD